MIQQIVVISEYTGTVVTAVSVFVVFVNLKELSNGCGASAICLG